VSEPRVLTAKEIQTRFFEQVYALIDYCDREDRRPTSREKLELFAFSLMNIFDGTSGGMGCGFLLVPTCHPSDPDYHQEQGENWFPTNEKVQEIMEGEISDGDMLHDTFINFPHRKR
jgi:hypothetical protein